VAILVPAQQNGISFGLILTCISNLANNQIQDCDWTIIAEDIKCFMLETPL